MTKTIHKKAAPVNSRETSDFGTREFLAKTPVEIGDADLNNPGIKRARNVEPSPLARHWRRQEITHRQFRAGEMFGQYWHWAGLGAIRAANLEPRIGGSSQTPIQRQVAAKRSVEKAIAALQGDLAAIAIHVCGQDGAAADWAKLNGFQAREGITTLRLALNALAKHFRLR